MLTKFTYVCFISTLLFTQAIACAADNKSPSGFIDFNLYPYLSDIDNDNSLTINAGATLANRFSYFSLTNFGNQADKSALSELDTYYTEQNLRWQVTKDSPLDLTLQMNFRTGQDNDRHRLGFRWRLNNTQFMASWFKSIHLAWSINFHLIQFDDVPADVWQMEHVFRMTFPGISDRLYLSGFIDHTFNEDLAANVPNNPMVAEAQLGYRMIDNFYVIAEYRLNQYRRADVNNFTAGFEYMIKW